MEEIHSRCGTGKGLSWDSREAGSLSSTKRISRAGTVCASILRRVALIMLMLANAYAQVQFHPPVLQVYVQGNQRVSLALHPGP